MNVQLPVHMDKAAFFNDKAAEYLRPPNLAAYVAFAQHEPKAWLWLGFPSTPEVVAGRDLCIQVPALSIELPLSQIYAGIKFN